MAQGIFTKRQQLRALVEKSWGISSAPSQVEYLVVAGGGGGGKSNGGGGGAGGLLQGIVPVINGTTYTVTVGGGGSGATTTSATGGSGCNSVFGNIIAIGGGGGASENGSYASGVNGGSGGGGLYHYSSITAIPGQGISGQGNAGGFGGDQGSYGYYHGGGGGGAGTVGSNAVGPTSTGIGGNGGAGISSGISGILTVYAGGGGGASHSSSNKGVGGVGGGGNGGEDVTPTSPVAGTANTGGGGGGGYNSNNGASGGVGIVIIRYPGSVQYYTGGTVWASYDGYVVHSFISSGTLAPTTPTKLNPYPVAFGAPYGGGYFAGRITIGGTLYNLVVSPKASGYDSGSAKPYKTANTDDGTSASSYSDGLANSNAINDASHPAAQFTRGLTIGGYSDWYLPSVNELEVIYNYLKPGTTLNNTTGGLGGSNAYASAPELGSTAYTTTRPPQTPTTLWRSGGTESFEELIYITSTSDNGSSYARNQYFDNGEQWYDQKIGTNNKIRAIRKVVA